MPSVERAPRVGRPSDVGDVNSAVYFVTCHGVGQFLIRLGYEANILKLLLAIVITRLYRVDSDRLPAIMA